MELKGTAEHMREFHIIERLDFWMEDGFPTVRIAGWDYEASVIRTSDGIEVEASVVDFDDDNMRWVVNKAIASRLLDEIPDPSRTDDEGFLAAVAAVVDYMDLGPDEPRWAVNQVAQHLGESWETYAREAARSEVDPKYRLVVPVGARFPTETAIEGWEEVERFDENGLGSEERAAIADQGHYLYVLKITFTEGIGL